jgi:hypothetical protein
MLHQTRQLPNNLNPHHPAKTAPRQKPRILAKARIKAKGNRTEQTCAENTTANTPHRVDL